MKSECNKKRWMQVLGWRKPLACIVVSGLALLWTMVSVSPATAMGSRPHCEVCRRFTDTSPASMQTAYRFGRRVVGYRVCSIFCYLEFIEDFTEHEPESIRVVNYKSLDWEMVLYVNAQRAYYLYEVEGDDQKTHEPYAVAFANEKEAKTAQEDLGGEIMHFDELAELIKELTDEYEPGKPKPLHKSNLRKRR